MRNPDWGICFSEPKSKTSLGKEIFCWSLGGTNKDLSIRKAEDIYRSKESSVCGPEGMTSIGRWGSDGLIMAAVWVPWKSVGNWNGSQVGTRD